MESQAKKLNFFGRIKIAIAKLEDYSKFLEEKKSVAVKYFFLLILVFAIVISVVETYQVMQYINKGYNYVKDELPDFSYENGKLTFSEQINTYDKENDFYIISDTLADISNETISEYKDSIKSNGLILLQDKIIYVSGNESTDFKYIDLFSNSSLNSIDKQSLIQKVEDVGMFGIMATLLIVFIVSIYIVQIISVFIDWICISVLTYLTSKICKFQMYFSQAFSITIYAMTLSIILSIIYNIAYDLFGFYTKYFSTISFLISYVYIVAVILIMKSDMMKQQMEVQKIVKIQGDVHNELNEQDENTEKPKDKTTEEPKKDRNDDTNEKKENSNNGEPNGSEI